MEHSSVSSRVRSTATLLSRLQSQDTSHEVCSTSHSIQAEAKQAATLRRMATTSGYQGHDTTTARTTAVLRSQEHNGHCYYPERWFYDKHHSAADAVTTNTVTTTSTASTSTICTSTTSYSSTTIAVIVPLLL
eukprot:10569-Heterococcus_DN1.PRE.2